MNSSLLTKAAFQIGRHPYGSAGLGVAVVAAPFAIKNDDRGYFKSALITTPLLVSGAMAAGELYGGLRGANFGRVVDFAKQAPSYFKSSPVNPTVMPDIQAPTFEVDTVASQFYKRRETKPFDFARHQKQALKAFHDLKGKPEKEYLLSNALQHARLSALTPMEAAREPLHDVLPTLSMDEMEEMLNLESGVGKRFMNDEKFLKALNAGLGRARRLNDYGASTFGNAKFSSHVIEHGLMEGNDAWTALVRQRPQVAEALKGQLDAFREAVVVSDDVVKGEIGKVLSVRVTRQIGRHTKSFEIPIIDTTTGKVLMGKNYSQENVGRYIYNSTDVMAGDEFLARNLARDWHGLELDKQRAFYFGNVDPLDEWVNQEPAEVGMNDLAIKLKSNTAIPTSLPQFEGADGMATFDQLDPSERIALVESLVERGMVKVSAEGSYNKGVMDLPDLELLHVGGIYDPSKQMAEFRSHAKPFHLTTIGEGAYIPDKFAPFIHTNAYEQMFGEHFVAEAGVRVGGVSPGVVSMFGDLPAQLEQFQQQAAGQRFMTQVQANHALNEMQARRVWEQMQRRIRTQGDLDAVRSLGRLGEGGFLTRRNLMGLSLQGGNTYYVNELRLTDQQILDFSGNSFGSNVVLGYSKTGEAITAQGQKNFIEKVSHLGDGRIAVKVREHHPFDTGIKLDVNGIKGFAYAVDDNQFETIRNVLNDYQEEVGGWGKKTFRMASDVNMIALTNWMHDKSDPFHGLLGVASDTLRRIDNIREAVSDPAAFTSLANDYLPRLQEMGFSFEHGSIVEDANALRKLTADQRRSRVAYLTELTEGFLTNVGEQIRAKGGYGDELFVNYRRAADWYSRNSQGKPGGVAESLNFAAFVEHVGLPSTMRAWDTSLVNLPHETKLTFDMMSNLYMRGHHGALRDILERVEYPQGDPAQARQLLEHVLDGDFSKPFGNVVSLENAFPAGTDKMGTAASRANSIFDPSNPLTRDNFSLDLGPNAKRRYVPMLGHDAFGGRVNQYEFDSYSQTELEKAIRNIHRATGAERDSAVDDYLLKLRQTMYGKDGLLRANAVDPGGLGGFIQTAPSSLRNAAGEVNPFEVAIGHDALDRIKDSRLRRQIKQAFENGDEVFANLTRHPVSAMPFVKVRLDENLAGTNITGIDPSMRGWLHADDDKDMSWLFFHKPGSAGAAEAAKAIEEGSRQHKELSLFRALEGVGDDARRIVADDVKPFTQRILDAKDGLLSKYANRVRTLRDRTAGGAIGQFSNTLTRMMMQLEQNQVIAQGDKEMFANALWLVRQAPIAAQKGGTGQFDLQWARNMSMRLNDHLNQGDWKGLHGSLMEVANYFQKEQEWIPEMEMLGLTRPAEGKLKPIYEMLAQNSELVEKFVSGMSRETDQAYQLITASDESLNNAKRVASLDEAFRVVGASNKIPYMQGASRGASDSSSRLGQINQGIREFAGGAKQAASDVVNSVRSRMNLGGAARMMGIGVGLAALAGVMSARPSFDRRPSGNKLRPEEVAGAQDHIPGAPVTGSRSPSAPPRVVRPAAPVRTTYVAPVHQQVSLEVQARGDDKQAAIESAKMIARMSGDGTANITVHHRDSTRIHSLRFRQKMRDQLDQS